jgi:hypothetical protein
MALNNPRLLQSFFSQGAGRRRQNFTLGDSIHGISFLSLQTQSFMGLPTIPLCSLSVTLVFSPPICFALPCASLSSSSKPMKLLLRCLRPWLPPRERKVTDDWTSPRGSGCLRTKHTVSQNCTSVELQALILINLTSRQTPSASVRSRMSPFQASLSFKVRTCFHPRPRI